MIKDRKNRYGIHNAVGFALKQNLLLVWCCLGVACAGAQNVRPQTTVATSETAACPTCTAESVATTAGNHADAAVQQPTQRGAAAHHLVVAAGACWLGGLWSDAEGVSDLERGEASKKRCSDLIQQAYGSFDKVRFERIRALEEVEVSELAGKIDAAAKADNLDASSATQLRTLLNLVANAEREMMFARRAADKVKSDIAATKPTSKRKSDETSAASPLSETRGFEALMAADVGDLNHELRAFGLLLAMDRMELARGLPKHLKVLVMRGPIATLFGVTGPALPEDPARPPVGGAWLAYLTNVAKAVEHPVPAQAKTLRDQELLAWGGTLMGFADKLNLEARGISAETELRHVVEAVVRRLQTQYRADEAAMLKASEPQPTAQPSR
jgi:hypothetical protein